MLNEKKIKELLQDINEIQWQDNSMEEFKDAMYEGNFEEKIYDASDIEIDNYCIIGTHSINTNISPLFNNNDMGDRLYFILKRGEDEANKFCRSNQRSNSNKDER